MAGSLPQSKPPQKPCTSPQPNISIVQSAKNVALKLGILFCANATCPKTPSSSACGSAAELIPAKTLEVFALSHAGCIVQCRVDVLINLEEPQESMLFRHRIWKSEVYQGVNDYGHYLISIFTLRFKLIITNSLHNNNHSCNLNHNVRTSKHNIGINFIMS